MVTYFLDSSAILRFTDNEAGAPRVREILRQMLRGDVRVAVSALHWGEAAGKLSRKRGRRVMDRTLQRLVGLGITVVPVTADQAVSAALFKLDHKIPYVDAFGPALVSAPDHVFVTADFDLKAAAPLVSIEFLPAK